MSEFIKQMVSDSIKQPDTTIFAEIQTEDRLYRLTALSTHVKSYGGSYKTTFRLNGDAISRLAAELIADRYPIERV